MLKDKYVENYQKDLYMQEPTVDMLIQAIKEEGERKKAEYAKLSHNFAEFVKADREGKLSDWLKSRK